MGPWILLLFLFIIFFLSIITFSATYLPFLWSTFWLPNYPTVLFFHLTWTPLLDQSSLSPKPVFTRKTGNESVLLFQVPYRHSYPLSPLRGTRVLLFLETSVTTGPVENLCLRPSYYCPRPVLSFWSSFSDLKSQLNPRHWSTSQCSHVPFSFHCPDPTPSKSPSSQKWTSMVPAPELLDIRSPHYMPDYGLVHLTSPSLLSSQRLEFSQEHGS